MIQPMNLKTKLIVSVLFLIITTVSLVPPVMAASTWTLQIVPKGCLLEKAPVCEQGNDNPDTCCGLNAMLQILINVSQIILSLTGSAALLMFMYGGITFIIAGGAQDKISKAKDILKASVIGIAIILCSWIIVNTVISALTDGTVSGGKLFGDQDWNKTPSSSSSN